MKRKKKEETVYRNHVPANDDDKPFRSLFIRLSVVDKATAKTETAVHLRRYP